MATVKQVAAPEKKRLSWGARLLRFLAIAYPLGLLAIICGIRFIGERWWLTTVLLYLPRLGFGLPLLPLAFALLWLRPRHWLVTQVVSLFLLLVPLMGLRVTLPRTGRPDATHLRVFSFNMAGAPAGIDAIAAEIRQADADLVFLQEAWSDEGPQLQSRFPGYHFHFSGQFVTASRYPLIEVLEPPKIAHLGQMRSARFWRYRITLPSGATIQAYNMHPLSPRDAFQEMRGMGLRTQVMNGEIFESVKGRQAVDDNATLRTAHVQAVAEDASRASEPVLIAGDTNLPSLSATLARFLGRFQDGFSEAGNGFGYTFPAKRPWMHIDRVLADGHFRFLGFRVIKGHASDHLAVVADLELAPSDSPK